MERLCTRHPLPAHMRGPLTPCSRRPSRHPVDSEPDHVGPQGQHAPISQADDASLAPAGPRDSPCGGRRDGTMIRVPTLRQRWSIWAARSFLPSGERRAFDLELLIFKPIPSCHARAARRARGAERERALAGASGCASGPCRPGLTQRKETHHSSPRAHAWHMRGHG